MSGSNPSIAISVRNVRKCYQIYDRHSDRLKQFIVPRLKRLAGATAEPYFRDFWALDDVSLNINQGSSVGIVGLNGSGKSTLLQIICGTLSPTSGSVETHGRIAALLELGSGFNPEFSGSDNVRLNATLLGLSADEIDQRFDAIAAFADIGQHLDQPVKTYSSGMFLRLGFAVIAHVDADILVVDEAMAVGDAAFTQKCMRFIRGFQERGTLLFVSHDTAAVQNLCESAIWLNKGKIARSGGAKEVSHAYLRHTLQGLYGDELELSENTAQQDQAGEAELTETRDNASTEAKVLDYGTRMTATSNLENATSFGTGKATIDALTLNSINDPDARVFEGGERVRITVRATVEERMERPILGFVVRDRLGQDLFGENTLQRQETTPCSVEAGEQIVGEFVFHLPMLPNGQYAVMASVADGEQYDNVQHHYLHDGLILTVSSAAVRFGLVGVPIESISLCTSAQSRTQESQDHQ